ncbi:MAG: uL22 family ribosomal protein [Candidatus Shapirobacteria bacterium]|jgi:ribosomal protein L22
MTTVKFSHPNVPISPRKIRALVATVKKMAPVKALISLKFTNSKSARILEKFVRNAVAAAKSNNQLTPESLKFDSFQVDEGLKIKRMDKSHGSRFARGVIQKRHSRLSLTLSGVSDKIASQQ